MTRRLAALALAVLATLSVLTIAGAVGAQTAGNTGEYTHAALTDGGLEKTEGPSSQRFLGDYGSAVVRYGPVGPFSAEWNYLEPGTTIHPDEVTLRTVRLAPEAQIDRELTVVVVAWEEGTREVVRGNETVERPAAVNQTVHRQQVDLGRGYDEAQIDLPDNLYRTAETTMWIQEHPDARWRFKHHGLPTQATIDMDSEGDAMGYATQHVLVPGLIAVAIGLGAARATLRKTGTGPRWGLVIWAIVAFVLLAVIFSLAYFQLSVVLHYFEYLLAVPLGIFAYGGGLWLRPAPKRVGFERLELEVVRDGPDGAVLTDRGDSDDDDPQLLTDGGKKEGVTFEEALQHLERETAAAKNGDRTNGHDEPRSPGTGLREIKEERYVDLVELPAIETDDGAIRIPKKGLRPFLARLFADPATLSKKNLMTKVSVDRGRLDEKILVDPESEQPVVHEPAHLERRWPVLYALDEDASLASTAAAVVGLLTLLVGLPAAGYVLGGQLGIPVVGAAVGALPALIDAYTAVDGAVEFEPAHEHFQRARATLVDLQREHADAKHIKDKDAEVARERARTAKEILEYRNNEMGELTAELLGARVGLPYTDESPEPADDAGDEGGDEADE